MSEPVTSVSVEHAPVISMKSAGPPKHSKAKKVVLLVTCVIVLATVGVLLLVHKSSAPSAKLDNRTSAAHARELNDGGNYTAARNYALQQSSSASSAADKASWYTQASTSALNAGQYDDALTYAQKAYAISPSSATAYGVSQAYIAKGDTANGRKYLQLAINTLDKSRASYQITKKQYMQQLAEL